MALLPRRFSYLDSGASPNSSRLWYRHPAERWLEALPVGNGRLGAMIFGGIGSERIALSESTLWSGAPSDANMNPEALAHLPEIRDLLFRGKYVEGGQLCKEYLLGFPQSYGTNLPMADLCLDFAAKGEPHQYRRLLDLDTAIARVEYRINGLRFYREVFASNPAQVIVVRLGCDRPREVTFSASFANVGIPAHASVDDNTLVLRGHAWERLHSDGRQGVAFESRVQILVEGGTVWSDGDSVNVRNVDSATLVIATASSYQGGRPEQLCETTLKAAGSSSYEQLRRIHVDDYRSLFRRVSIDLGTSPHAIDLPTDHRRKAIESGNDDPELCALFFQYGRYLTIAGSRANSPLPMALQGIWNDGLASNMGWTDDYHLDINIEQNYWAAEVCNLPETHEPLFRLVENLCAPGRVTAEKMYSARGWVSHVCTNAWGFTAPGWGLGWGLFVTGGVWIALQMWQHYLYTGDVQFLRQHAYPVLKEASEFYLSYMVEHPRYGWLVTGPSVSPENWFLTPEGAACSESMGPTCDRVLVYALFSACIEASKILDVDAKFRNTVGSARDKLSPFQIGKHGQLQEWLEDFAEAQPNHRHTSHLIALYPDDQISPLKTPALSQAARVTIERRINHPNWEDTEWSRANLINYFARLFDGDAAHHHLLALMSKDSDNSLLTYSRSGVAGAAQNIFAIDGNCAGAAGIAEMLLQSQGGEIHLLPALPVAWPSGHISGLCARGGFQVELRWKGSKLQSAVLSSSTGGRCSVRYAGKVISVEVGAGRTVHLGPHDFAPDASHSSS
jgi:alpha-L-fucosidase 2